MENTISAKKETTLDDRLSSLSDHLLLCILGNLNTLDAVKTCVLSRRWRNLWKSLPDISFVGPYPLYESFRDSMESSLIRAEKRQRAFSDIVTQVLLRRDHSDLVKFHLFPNCKTDPYLVESSLEYAIKHNVKFMELGMDSYRYQRDIVFPRCFFDCSSLQGLKLRYACYECITWPRHFNWPALKSLCLGNFIVGKGNFDGRIFSSCPSLETLKLDSLRTPRDLKEKKFDIHSLSLRSLELVYRNLEDHFLSAHMIVIVAPKLTSFQFSGYKPVVCSVEAPSLQNVTINLVPMIDLYSFDENAQQTILRSIKMVNEFRLAKSLSITIEAVEVLSALPGLLELHLRKFEQLKDLKLMMPVPLELGECFPISPRILSYFFSSFTSFKLEGVKSGSW